MPPRRSASVAEAEERAVDTFGALPLPLFLCILTAVPADSRARAACVSRQWRAAVAERSLWRTLDLTPEGGFTRVVTDAVLRGAAARAHGELHTLRLAAEPDMHFHGFKLLHEIVAHNAATLSVLQVHELYFPVCIEVCQALLRGAPSLQTFEVEVRCNTAEARRLLRNEPPYGPLQMRKLCVDVERSAGDAELAALAVDLPMHRSLEELTLFGHWRPITSQFAAVCTGCYCGCGSFAEPQTCGLTGMGSAARERSIAGASAGQHCAGKPEAGT